MGPTPQRLTEAGYLLAWRAARALPYPLVRRVFTAAADRASSRGGRGVDRLAANLRRVVGPALPEPELRLLVRDGMRSYARYWLEAFRLPSWSTAEILRRFRLDEPEPLEMAIAAGRGVILALPHIGNWDLAGAWVASKGWPIVTVAERLRPEGLFERFLAYRQALGMEVLPLTGGDRPVLDVLSDRLTAGGVVALVADRDLTARWVEVDFFGAVAKMPPGPALLAIRTGAPLLTVSLWFEREACHASVGGPVPIPGPEAGSLPARVGMVTQRMADDFAAGIARHPSDWHMLQRVWMDEPVRTAG